jgi:hypothetical protein
MSGGPALRQHNRASLLPLLLRTPLNGLHQQRDGTFKDVVRDAWQLMVSNHGRKALCQGTSHGDRNYFISIPMDNGHRRRYRTLGQGC